MNQGRSRRKFDTEFKREAVGLSRQPGMTPVACDQLGKHKALRATVQGQLSTIGQPLTDQSFVFDAAGL